MSRRGFTLIELLVVIAIIAILAAILFPVFARARAKAIQNTCLSNVKQINLGLMMYVQDNDQFFPPDSRGGGCTTGNWVNAVVPYIKNTQIWACPEDRTKAAYGSVPVVSYGIPGGYKYTSGLYYWADCTAACLLWFQNPVGMITIAEFPGNWGFGVGYGVDQQHNLANCPWNHNGGMNLGFADGHVKWMMTKNLTDNPNWVY